MKAIPEGRVNREARIEAPKGTNYIVPVGEMNRPKSEIRLQQKEIKSRGEGTVGARPGVPAKPEQTRCPTGARGAGSQVSRSAVNRQTKNPNVSRSSLLSRSAARPSPPEQPGQPARPERVSPAKPAQPEQPAARPERVAPARPSQPERPGQPARPERVSPAKPGQPEQPAARPERVAPARPSQPEQPGQPARPERVSPAKPAPPQQPAARPERVAPADRVSRSSPVNRQDRNE